MTNIRVVTLRPAMVMLSTASIPPELLICGWSWLLCVSPHHSHVQNMSKSMAQEKQYPPVSSNAGKSPTWALNSKIIYKGAMLIWLVVSTIFKNMISSELGWLFPIYGKLENVPNIARAKLLRWSHQSWPKPIHVLSETSSAKSREKWAVGPFSLVNLPMGIQYKYKPMAPMP